MKRLGILDTEHMVPESDEAVSEVIIHLLVYDPCDNSNRVVAVHETAHSESDVDDDVEPQNVHYQEVLECFRTFVCEPQPPRMAFPDEDAFGPPVGAGPPLSQMGSIVR